MGKIVVVNKLDPQVDSAQREIDCMNKHNIVSGIFYVPVLQVEFIDVKSYETFFGCNGINQ